MKKRFGFTLIEMAVVIALVGFLSLAAVNMFLESLRSANQAQTNNEIRQNASLALEHITRQIRKSACARRLGSSSSSLLLYSNITCADSSLLTRFDLYTASGVTYIIQDNNSARKLTADFVHVENLAFSDPAVGPIQITLVVRAANLAAKAEFQGRITLVESVALRNY